MMKSDLIAIIDVLLDIPSSEPDLAAVKNIAATTETPIELLAQVVRLLWLSGERPEQFDAEISELYE